MDPVIRECVRLMIVVVCVCRLGEEYMRGCGCVCVCGYLGEADKRDMFPGVIVCIMDCF